jgi:1L-myo-inositol 1-phosphate cytidylyltransferase
VRAVILAAGNGGRLRPATLARPKPLVSVMGRPLIAYTVESLSRAGIRHVVVVTGYRGDQLRQALGSGSAFGCSISYVSNDAFRGGNGYSLYRARASTEGRPFVLAMADHLVSKDLVEAVASGKPERPRLAVDFGRYPGPVVKESTKVKVRPDGRVVAIGKGLNAFNAIDTGVFYLTSDVFDYFPTALHTAELSHVMQRYLARVGGFYATDVTGAFWWDIDTLEDLRTAEGLLAQGA